MVLGSFGDHFEGLGAPLEVHFGILGWPLRDLWDAFGKSLKIFWKAFGGPWETLGGLWRPWGVLGVLGGGLVHVGPASWGILGVLGSPWRTLRENLGALEDFVDPPKNPDLFQRCHVDLRFEQNVDRLCSALDTIQ